MARYAYRDHIAYFNFHAFKQKDWFISTDWDHRKDFWIEADHDDEIVFAPWRNTSILSWMQFNHSQD